MVKALAWDEEQSLKCAGCGNPRDRSFHPDAEGTYTPHKLRCHACSVKQRAERDAASSENTDPDGLYVAVDGGPPDPLEVIDDGC